MKTFRKYILAVAALAVLTLVTYETALSDDDQQPNSRFDRHIDRQAEHSLDEGRQIFRYDTFGDESFWGDTLKLHLGVLGSGLGGVGPGLSPRTALGAGLKVDADALPDSIVAQLKHGRINLDDPAVTVELLRHNAVVGLTGLFDARRNLRSIRDPVRSLSFQRRQQSGTWHRAASRRLGQSGLECRRGD